MLSSADVELDSWVRLALWGGAVGLRSGSLNSMDPISTDAGLLLSFHHRLVLLMNTDACYQVCLNMTGLVIGTMHLMQSTVVGRILSHVADFKTLE